MPYKRLGKIIYVKRKKRWAKLKTHPSVAAAIKHLRALNINVRHK